MYVMMKEHKYQMGVRGSNAETTGGKGFVALRNQQQTDVGGV